MMAGMTHAPRSQPRQTLVLGIILICIGLGALAATFYPDVGTWVVLLIGLGLLAVFAFTREYGALVPAGILTGLGAGILAASQSGWQDEAAGGLVVTGLGLGFLSIWVIGTLSRVAENHPWPLIPGGILTTIGVALLVGGMAFDLLRYWPVILIAIGIVVIGRSFLERRD